MSIVDEITENKQEKLLADAFGWDVINWSKAVPFWMSKSKLNLAETEALELGVGGQSGGVSLFLASQGATVVCTNIEEPDVAVKEWHKNYQLDHLIKCQQLDLFEMDYKEQFDLVALKSLLVGLAQANDFDRQKNAIRKAYEALKPGGELWFIENLVATPVHMLLRKVSGSRHYCRYLSYDELPDLFSDFASLEVQTTGFLGVFGRNERQKQFLGKIDQQWLGGLPTRWNYIVMGVARKAL